MITAVEKATGRKVPVREVGPAGRRSAGAGRRRAPGRAQLGWKPRYPELDTIVAHAARWHGRPQRQLPLINLRRSHR